MHVYKTLRKLTLALRVIETALIESLSKVGAHAEAMADRAVDAGHAALDKQENSALDKLIQTKNRTADIIEHALGNEESAHWDYQDAMDTIIDHRRMIETEVL